MPGPIQVIPPGLMGLLQLKTGGKLPSVLADVVAPVLEMRDWYLTARRVDEFALFGSAPTFNAVTGGFGYNILQAGGVNATVPNGQIWWVEQFHVDATIGTAADTIRYAAAIQGQLGNYHNQVGPDVNDIVTGAARRAAARADRGFWAYPGDQFCGFVYSVTSAGGITLTGHMRATVCPL